MAQAEETSLSPPNCVVTMCQNKGCLLGEIVSCSWQNVFFPPEPHLPGCSGTVAVIITVQIGHCKCQQVLIGLSSNETASVVNLLTWMQLYWYCRAYLVCLCHFPLELSRVALITVALRAGIAVTHGFVSVQKEPHELWPLSSWSKVVLPRDRSAVGCGQDVAAGAVGGVLPTFVCFLPCPCVPWAPQELPGSGAADEVHLPSALVTTLVEKVLRDPFGHCRFATLELWCCSTLYLLPKVFLLVHFAHGNACPHIYPWHPSTSSLTTHSVMS